MRPIKVYRTGALILTLVGMLALVSSLWAAESHLPEEQYWRRLEATRDRIAGLKALPLPEARQQLMEEADQWEAVTELLRPDGTAIPIDPGFLAAQLRANPPDLPRLEQWLSTLLAARQAPPGQELTGQETELLESILARAEFQWEPSEPSALESILARAEFQWEPSEPSALERFLQDAADAFWRLVSRLVPDTMELGAAPLLRYLLTGLGALALVLALGFALKGLMAGLVPESELEPDLEAGDEHLTSASAMKRAQELSLGGDYRSAVRYLYLSALFLLEERGLLRYDRSLTNREYLRSVAHMPGLAERLSGVVEVFDRVWYGYQPLDKATYSTYVNQVDALKRQK